MATNEAIRAAAEYVPPIQFGMSEHARYGGISITSTKDEDVWDVLVKLKNAHEILATACLAIINRTPAEAAKAAAEECCEKAGTGYARSRESVMESLSAIIQRHTPPVNERLLDALQRIINNTPCMEGGDCFYPRHDPDGEYIGEESVNPLDVISGAAQIAAEALAEARAALEGK